jgi:hypothetical protein
MLEYGNKDTYFFIEKKGIFSGFVLGAKDNLFLP